MRLLPLPAARLLLLLCALPLAACAGSRGLSKNRARDVIAALEGATFDKEEVYIERVSQTGQRDAVVEATLRAAFKFEKAGDKWVIREVRLGQRPWEDLDDILRALEHVKSHRTRSMLETVAAAIDRYREQKGTLPSFRDFVDLTDALHPEHLNPLIREDAWHQPFVAQRLAEGSLRLSSPGPDGRPGTADDIELLRNFP